MTVNQHEGTYRAATRMTYRLQDCMTLFQAGLLIKSHDFLNLFFLFYFHVLGHFIQVVSGCLRLVDSKKMEQVSVRTQIHMIHTPKESTDSCSQNQLCKKMLFQQQKNNSTTVEADTKPASLFCFVFLSNDMMIMRFITISTCSYGQHFSHTEEKKKKKQQCNLVNPNENEGLNKARTKRVLIPWHLACTLFPKVRLPYKKAL